MAEYESKVKAKKIRVGWHRCFPPLRALCNAAQQDQVLQAQRHEQEWDSLLTHAELRELACFLNHHL